MSETIVQNPSEKKEKGMEFPLTHLAHQYLAKFRRSHRGRDTHLLTAWVVFKALGKREKETVTLGEVVKYIGEFKKTHQALTAEAYGFYQLCRGGRYVSIPEIIRWSRQTPVTLETLKPFLEEKISQAIKMVFDGEPEICDCGEQFQPLCHPETGRGNFRGEPGEDGCFMVRGHCYACIKKNDLGGWSRAEAENFVNRRDSCDTKKRSLPPTSIAEEAAKERRSRAPKNFSKPIKNHNQRF